MVQQQTQDSAAIHGLAATIRSSTESETFDLGGLSASTIESLVKDAFGVPLPLQEMIRITLIVGAGKQARQKYDAAALKTVTATLQSFNFVEDRGASCVVECAGMYKLQHDTGKNVKTVVVFPKVQGGDSHANEDDSDQLAAAASGSKESSLEGKLRVCTLAVFTNMVQSKCPTWSQKKALLKLLEDILAQLDDCDQLLMKGQLLSPAQQSFYDSCRELTDKRTWLQAQLHAHVDRGDLTHFELEQLKHANDQKLQELKAQGKSTVKAQERHDILHKMVPVDLPKLKHHAELGKLWKQLTPLQHLDESSGRLLSVQETQLLGKKMELLEQIEELEQASRGWLEDEDIFQDRVLRSRKQFQQQFGIGSAKQSKNKAAGGGGGGGGATSISSTTKVRVPVSKWVTPMETKKSAAQAKKKARLEKGDVFGAMMGTYNDHDEEESQGSDEEEDVQHPSGSSQGPTTSSSTKAQPTATGGGKSNKKKNKKKKGDSSDNVEPSFAGQSSNTGGSTGDSGGKKKNAKKKKNEESSDRATASATEETSSLVSTAQVMFQDYLMPFLLAIVTWLVGLLFGKPKPGKSTKKTNRMKAD